MKPAVPRTAASPGVDASAAMGAAAGMAWIVDGRYNTIAMAISSMIGDVSGMICDGASNSCAMKVSTSASAAWKAVLMALAYLKWCRGGDFTPNPWKD